MYVQEPLESLIKRFAQGRLAEIMKTPMKNVKFEEATSKRQSLRHKVEPHPELETIAEQPLFLVHAYVAPWKIGAPDI